MSEIELKRNSSGALELHGLGAPFSLKLDSVVRRLRNSDKETLNRCFRKLKGKKVLDATMGWATDSLIIASLGYEVISLEQIPEFANLVDDAIQRAKKDFPDLEETFSRIHIQNLNCLQWTDPVDIIYLDPMFRESKKTASLPNRGMQILEALNSHYQKMNGSGSKQIISASNEEILEWALAFASEAVIMKQHSSANPIRRPSWQIEGKLIHYDIFKI